MDSTTYCSNRGHATGESRVSEAFGGGREMEAEAAQRRVKEAEKEHAEEERQRKQEEACKKSEEAAVKKREANPPYEGLC